MGTRLSQYRKVEPALIEQRNAERHPVVVTRTSVRRHGDASATALLCDLSIYGCRLQSPIDEKPGERVWLRLAGGLPIGATAIWNQDGHTGFRFDAPLDRQVVRRLSLGCA